MTALAINDKQMALVRRTVAKDANNDEFDMFMEICKRLRLNPLMKQAYCNVYNKTKPDKRQMVVIIGIGGYRAIADRTGNYRPGTTGVCIDPELVNTDTNPKGIDFAVASVFKYAHGEWHEFQSKVYWDEMAPIKEEWKEDPETGKSYRTGKMVLDRSKDQWIKRPRGQLEKCAEAAALRKGWPEDYAGTYAPEEMDRADVLDLTPSELATAADTEDRLAKIGGANKIMMDWCEGNPLEPVPIGKLGDQALAFVKAHADEPSVIMQWRDKNRYSLQEYWARDKDGALAVKAEIERVLTQEAEACPTLV